MFLNSSRVSTWNLCNRRHYFDQEFEGVGLRAKVEPDYFMIGRAVHEGLSVLYSSGKVELAAALARESYLNGVSANWDGALLDVWIEQADFAAKMITEYDKDHPPDDFTVRQTESRFAVPLGELCWNCGHPYMFDTYADSDAQTTCDSCGAAIHYWCGTTDVDLVRQGHMAIMDHKTSKYTPDDDFMSKFGNSFQLIGYVYGRGKEAGYPIEMFGVNVLQKAKTMGEPQATTKTCPTCRAGKKKVLTCAACERTGRVAKDLPLSPFRRKWFSVVPSDIDRFVLTMQRVIKNLEDEKNLMLVEPEIAYPMNDKACRVGPCPYVDLCWGAKDATQWFHPEPMCLNEFKPREQDYVSLKQIAMEDD